jgi:hypothetical protein
MSAPGLRFHDCSFFANEDSLDGSGYVAPPFTPAVAPVAEPLTASQGSESEDGMLLFNRDPPPGYQVPSVKAEPMEKSTATATSKPRLMLGILRPPPSIAGGKKLKQQKMRKKKVTIQSTLRTDDDVTKREDGGATERQLSSLTTELLAHSPPKRTKATVAKTEQSQELLLSSESAPTLAMPALLVNGHAPTSGSSKAKRKAEKLRLDRTGNACLCCRQAKIRCDEQYPCRRCVKKGQECIKTIHLPRGRKPKPGPLSLYLRKKKERLEKALESPTTTPAAAGVVVAAPSRPTVKATVVTVDITSRHATPADLEPVAFSSSTSSATIPPPPPRTQLLSMQAKKQAAGKQAASKEALNVLLRQTLGGLSSMTRNLQQTISAQRQRSQDLHAVTPTLVLAQ